MGYDSRIKRCLLEMPDVIIRLIPCENLHKYRHVLYLSKFTTDDKHLKESIHNLFHDFRSRVINQQYVQPPRPVGDVVFYPLAVKDIPARFIMTIEHEIFIVKLDTFYL